MEYVVEPPENLFRHKIDVDIKSFSKHYYQIELVDVNGGNVLYPKKLSCLFYDTPEYFLRLKETQDLVTVVEHSLYSEKNIFFTSLTY